MKTLLINPPENTESNMSLRLKLPPLGILYIAACLERAGMPVEILDANFSDDTPENAANKAIKKNPDIVGITATAVTLKNALNIVGSIKRANPDIITMVGGPHVTYLPSETLEACPDLDIVAIGEGEETVLELTRALKGFSRDHSRRNSLNEFSSRIEGVKGIAYRGPNDQGDIRFTPSRPLIEDLDSIPFPARHLVPMDKYTVFNKNETAGMIMTSRGCPFACNYCISSRMAGVKFRARSAKNVVDEVEFLYRQYGLKNIEFIDDLFMMNHARAKEISDEIKARGIDILWSASSRVNTVSDRLVGYLKKSGLKALYFGVESGSQRMLDIMNKRITLEQVRTAFRITRHNEVDTIGSFMFGYPGETLGEMKQTISFSVELDPDLAQYTILTPYPGTPIYDELKDSSLIGQADWDAYTFVEPIINYKAFGYSGKNVKRMLIQAYMRFYLRPSYIFKHPGTIPTILRIIGRNVKSHLKI